MRQDIWGRNFAYADPDEVSAYAERAFFVGYVYPGMKLLSIVVAADARLSRPELVAALIVRLHTFDI